MKYISTRPNQEQVSFKEAVINGLSENGGLYFPENIPQLPTSFFEEIEKYSHNEIAFKALHPFVQGSLNDEQLNQVIADTLSFSFPLEEVEKDVFALELFHGPTKAFKDVGARFMSRCLSHFYADQKEDVTILVATSGDTGSAVANGFFDIPGVAVKILFPKGKVSPYQEHQMASLGKNIQAIEVEGTFDDCQRLVKEAFNDKALRQEVVLSSANSINVARLLPQMLYYFFAYKELKSKLEDRKMVVSVPSGNLGNITAGLVAQQMGLPVDHFIAALNANDTFLNYLSTGNYSPKASVLTYSNAMDVGSPSNFERIIHLFDHDVEKVNQYISSYSFDNAATLQTIQQCYEQNEYLLDPHGAVGKLALSQYANEDTVGVFLGTAHPLKFSEVIKKVIPSYTVGAIDSEQSHKLSIENSYESLKEVVVG